jgi:hypothetical protein
MRIILIAGFMFLALTSRLFAEGSLCLDNNNSSKTCKIINLKEEDIKNLQIKDYTIFIFKKKTETLKGIARDDLLIAGACKEIPDGFIRKVVTAREDDGKVIVETVEGTFTDMLNSKLSDTSSAAVAKAHPAAKK